MKMACAGLSFAAAIVATSSSAQERAEDHGADAGLRRANQQEVAAFMATDPAALGRLWSKDFVVTNPLNQFATGPQVPAMVKGGTLSFKSYERTIEYIHHYGDIAVVVGAEKVEWVGKMPLAGKLLPLRFTAVWLSTPSGWQEVARHANVVPSPSRLLKKENWTRFDSALDPFRFPFVPERPVNVGLFQQPARG